MEDVLLLDGIQNTSDSDFAGLKGKVEILLPIFKKYNYEDLVLSIFCINSWRNNRSCFESSCSLNVALVDLLNSVLVDCENTGDRPITNYQNLVDFFNEIKDFLLPTIMDDLTLNDFGEVKIKYNENMYSVILGTGYEATYCMLEFIPQVCEHLKYEKMYEDVLQYSSNIINFLKDLNIPNNKNDIIFELPTKEYFEVVQRLFNTDFIPNAGKKFVELLSSNAKKERKHFYIFNDKVYPLFNVSIIADFNSIILREVEEKEKAYIVNMTLCQKIKNNFDAYSISKGLLCPASTADKNGFTSSSQYAFAINNGTDSILAINTNDFKNIDEEIKRIRDLHINNNLYISETIPRRKEHEYIGYNVPKEKKLHIIVYNNTFDITQPFAAALNNTNYHFYTPLDLVFFINCIDNFDELIEYLNFKEKDRARIMCTGLSVNHFIMWKEQGGMIEQGAIQFNLVNIGYGETDNYIYDLFVNKLRQFPFNIENNMLDNPFSWNIKDHEDGYQEFNSKSNDSLLGYGKYIGDNYLFLGHNVVFFEKEDFAVENREKIFLLDGINAKLFNRFGELLSNIFKSKFIYFLYMPDKYAKKVDNNGFTKQKKEYVYCDYMPYEGSIMFRYTCNLDKLIKDIQNAKDKEIEIKYFIELLSPLKSSYEKEYEQLKIELLKHTKEKKEVDTFSMKIEYYYSSKSPQFIIDNKYFLNAKKELAKICFQLGVKPENYNKADSVKIFELIEKDIVKFLEDKLKQYSKSLLTQKILKYLSSTIHIVNVDYQRYTKFTDVTDEVLKEIRDKSMNEREEYKKYTRLLQYLLEENLYVVRDSDTECTDEEFYGLCAYANWLIVLHDNASACIFSNEDISFTFDSQYLVNVEMPEDEEKKYENIQQRIYNYGDYWLKDEELDKKYIEKCISAFENDTGFEFILMIDILDYISLPQEDEKYFIENVSNVFEVDIETLVKEFSNAAKGKYKEENIRKALSFLTIIPEELKVIGKDSYPSIPIWNREQRNNRIETRPLIKVENKYIYSTVCCYDLKNRWKNGMMGIYPPFEIGLNNTLTMMKKWKEKYEEFIVKDIYEFLNIHKLGVVFKEKYLNKLDPHGSSHPEHLGDYDILLFDTLNKIIWNIECKFVQKVGSIFETSMQQKDFFEDNEKRRCYATKFQKRINYISDKNNYSRILLSLRIPIEDYTIKSYMVTNKVIAPLGYSINFELLCYYEFIETIRKQYNIKEQC